MHRTSLRYLLILLTAFALAACFRQVTVTPVQVASIPPAAAGQPIPATSTPGSTHTTEPPPAPTRTPAAPAVTPTAPAQASTTPSTSTAEPSAGFPALYHMRWFDLNHGWAVASLGEQALVHTEDGGQTWRNVMPDPSISIGMPEDDLFLLDGSTAWLLATLWDGGAASRVIYHTIDGGKTWQHWPAAFDGFDPNASTNTVAFFDRRNGWATVSTICPNACPVTLYRTSDGGKTWTLAKDITSPDGKKLEPGKIRAFTLYFQDLSTLWVGMDIDALYASRDGGKTWQKMRWMPEGATTAAMPLFLNNRQGFFPAWTDHGVTVNITSDGGKTWRPAPAPLPGHTAVDDYQFVTAQDWFFTSSTTLSATHDGGKTWETLATPRAGKDGLAVQFIDPANGWAFVRQPGAADSYALYRTADGGKTWQPLQPRLVGE